MPEQRNKGRCAIYQSGRQSLEKPWKSRNGQRRRMLCTSLHVWFLIGPVPPYRFSSLVYTFQTTLEDNDLAYYGKATQSHAMAHQSSITSTSSIRWHTGMHHRIWRPCTFRLLRMSRRRLCTLYASEYEVYSAKPSRRFGNGQRCYEVYGPLRRLFRT
jgi:hypothetical protein